MVFILFSIDGNNENKMKCFDVLPCGSGRARLDLVGLNWGKASGKKFSISKRRDRLGINYSCGVLPRGSDCAGMGKTYEKI